MSHSNWVSLSVGWILGSGIVGSKGTCFYNFASIAKLPFIKFVPIYTLTSNEPVPIQSNLINRMYYKYLNF